MLEDFIAEFIAQLNTNNYHNIDNAEKLYRDKYNDMLNSGHSDAEAISSLGNPVEVANKMCNISPDQTTISDTLSDDIITEDTQSPPVSSDGPKTKLGVYMTDALFMTPGTLLCAGGTIAMTFVSILSVVIGCMYGVKAWTEPLFESTGDRVIAFTIAIGVLIAGALGILLTAFIVKAMYKGMVAYLADRKKLLASFLANEQHSEDN